MITSALVVLAVVDPQTVKVVHLIQSNHLDVGFSDYVSQVMNRYLTGGWGTDQPPAPRWKPFYYDSFLLNAANTSRLLRAKKSAANYIYTQNAWVLHLFFHCNKKHFPRVPPAEAIRCPTAAQRKTILESLRRGDTTMHAFPTSAEAELFDVTTFEAGVDLGPNLLASLGLSGDVPNATVMQQRDVPGITRAVVPLLARKGVIGLSIGVNDGSPAPIVPSTRACVSGKRQVRTPFRWLDQASGESILVDMHPGGYGGILPPLPDDPSAAYFSRDGLLCDCVGVSGLDEVMCYSWRGDNYGPAGVNETEHNFRLFQAAFPQARVVGSKLDTFFAKLQPLRHTLPVLTSEIGDSWMYGSASDPFKLGAFRAMQRLRSKCVATPSCAAAEAGGLGGFSHLMHKLGEHTWGGSYAGHMNITQPDHDWGNDAFEKARAQSLAHAAGSDPFYRVAQATWDEQRAFVDAALDALDDAAVSPPPTSPPPTSPPPTSSPLASSPLAAAIRAELATLTAPPVADPTTLGYTPVASSAWDAPLKLGDATVAFDLSSGALTRFEPGRGRVSWANASHPLLRFAYRTHAYAEKARYKRTYGYSHGGEHPYPQCYPSCPVTPPSGASAPMHGHVYYARVSGMWTRGTRTRDGDGSSSSSSVLLQLNGSAMETGYSAFGAIWLNYSAMIAADDKSASAGDDSGGDVKAGDLGELHYSLDLAWATKSATRLPESTWLETRPVLPPAAATAQARHRRPTHSATSDDDKWRLYVTKLGSLVDTGDVVTNGGSALHGIDPDGPVVWSRASGQEAVKEAVAARPETATPSLRIVSLDAALIAPGNNTSPWEWDMYNAAPPDPRDGAAFNLANNLYTTNYILWYPWKATDATSRFRFRFDVS